MHALDILGDATPQRGILVGFLDVASRPVGGEPGRMSWWTLVIGLCSVVGLGVGLSMMAKR